MSRRDAPRGGRIAQSDAGAEMLIRVDVLIFAVLLLPLVLAGVVTFYFVDHPPTTWHQFVALGFFVGVPLYWAWIIVHYAIRKARRAYGSDYSHAFLATIVVAGY